MNKNRWKVLDTKMQNVMVVPRKILKHISQKFKTSIKKSTSDFSKEKLENEANALQNIKNTSDSILKKEKNKEIALKETSAEIPVDSVFKEEQTEIIPVLSLQKKENETIALQEVSAEIPDDSFLQEEQTEIIPVPPLQKEEDEPVALQESATEIPVDSSLKKAEKEISTDSSLQKKENKAVKEDTDTTIAQSDSLSPSSDSEAKEKKKTENLISSAENIWEEIKSGLKEQLPLHIHAMWIEPIEFIKYEADTIVLGCPNLFSRKRVQEEYRSLIKSEAEKILGKPSKIIIEVSERRNDLKKKKTKKTDTDPQLIIIPEPNVPILTIPNASNEKQNILIKKSSGTELIKGKANGRLLRKEFTFDRFIVGKNNDFAFSASLSLASQKEAAQNALFLLSDTGNGKSHLSQAIGHHILSHAPYKNICYMTAEDFTNEMVQAFRQKSADIFKEKFRTLCDVLILEDIHFLAGKEHTQTELALALDYLFDAGKKIIFTSCYLPANIPKMNEQLISRFSSGLITSIESPDFGTRLKILQQKLKESGYKIPADVADYLAAELSDNVRQLESGLIGVMAKSSLLKNPVDLHLAESVVKNIIRQGRHITIDSIKELVCEHFNISMKELISRSRRQSVLRPRQIAIYLSRKYTEHSLKVIGKSFNKYHTTVIHSIGTVEKELRTDLSLQHQLDFFSNKLESGVFLESKKA